MAESPTDWGAIPVTGESPLAWGAIPVTTAAAAPPDTDTPTIKRTKAAIAGGNEGIAGLLGTPVDAVLNTWDLAKAGAGSIQSKITGEAPSAMFDPSDKSQYLGSTQWFKNQGAKAGIQSDNPNPNDLTSRYLYAAGTALPAAATAAPTSLGSALKTAGANIIPALAGQAGHEANPDSAVAPILTSLVAAAAPHGAREFSNQMTAAKPPQQLTPAAATLDAAGVPLDAAQRTGSSNWRQVKELATDNPFTQTQQREFSESQLSAWRRAALRTMGENATAATPDVMDAARRRIGTYYEAVNQRVPIRIDPQLGNDVQNTLTRAQNVMGNTPEYRALRNQMTNIQSKIAQGGTIDFEQYQPVKAVLDDMVAGKGKQGMYAGQLRGAFSNALTRSATGTDAQLLQDADRQWKAMKQIEESLPAGGTGEFTPARLAGVLNTKKNAWQSKYGRGNQDLVELANAGSQVLTNRAPNSGTPWRGMLQAIGPGIVGGLGSLAKGDVTPLLTGIGGSIALPLGLQHYLTKQPTAAALSQPGPTNERAAAYAQQLAALANRQSEPGYAKGGRVKYADGGQVDPYAALQTGQRTGTPNDASYWSTYGFGPEQQFYSNNRLPDVPINNAAASNSGPAFNPNAGQKNPLAPIATTAGLTALGATLRNNAAQSNAATLPSSSALRNGAVPAASTLANLWSSNGMSAPNPNGTFASYQGDPIGDVVYGNSPTNGINPVYDLNNVSAPTLNSNGGAPLGSYAGDALGGGLGALNIYGGLQQGGVQGAGGVLKGAGSLASLGGYGDIGGALGNVGGLTGFASGTVGGDLQGASSLASLGTKAGLLDSGTGAALGTGLGALGAGYGVYNAVNNWESGNTGSDALNGASAGASIGTMVAPGIGTVIGGLIGGGVGALSSAFGGGKQSMADKMWRSFDKTGGNVNPQSISDTDMQHIWGGGYTSNENGALKPLNAALASVYGNQHSSDGQAWNFQNFVKDTISQAQAAGTNLSSLTPAQLYSQVIQPATAAKFGADAANAVPKSFANVIGVYGSKLANKPAATPQVTSAPTQYATTGMPQQSLGGLLQRYKMG